MMKFIKADVRSGGYEESKAEEKSSSSSRRSGRSCKEVDEDEEAEDEFHQMLRAPNVGKIVESSDPRAQKILKGFKMYESLFFMNVHQCLKAPFTAIG